ncbi:uncharacterized protein LOC131665275 [Phymastichus coffea]|uniref:uncharacterized protein LOC131665275 n=1 Tax=Phymastichus coffea TaxID=108790 RepID=UPI00273B10C1|nr:uncharacterized protein LOC131665275 [Phymastichus coffea]
MDEIEKRIARIVQKSTALKKAMQSLSTYLETEDRDETNATLRSKHIEGLFNEYVMNHEELISLQSDHPRITAFDDLQATYFDLASKVRKLRTPSRPFANSTMLNNTNVTFTERYDMPKLPPIPIPEFDGHHRNWTAWKNNFQSLIHDRTEFPGFVKHQRLKDAVKGLAAKVIGEFNPSDENYPLAWEALYSAYDQRRVVTNQHLDKLLKLHKITEASADALADLMYKVRQNVKLLKGMDVDIPDAIVVRLLEHSLPKSVESRWMDRLSSDKMPTLNELYEFIQNTIFKLRQMDDRSNNERVNKKRLADSKSWPPAKSQRMEARTLATTANTSTKHA